MSTLSEKPLASTGHPISTGVPGLDDILRGGLVPHRLYLIEGVPGSGKTTLAMQVLIEGVKRGESVLYVTLSETEEELHAIAASHGWSIHGMPIREMGPEETLRADDQNTMFHPSEVELTETTNAILAEVERRKPTLVVFDSLSELRLLSGSALRYRRQILGFKQFFAGRGCTVLLLDDMTTVGHDLQVQSIAHAVIRLEQLNPLYGSERRRLMVLKYRGVGFRGGYHDYAIRRGGLEVFPRLVASEHQPARVITRLASGLRELDQLLGGGIERGSSTLIVGPAGCGKSSLATRFVLAAAERGDRSAMFIFDESISTLLMRSEGLGMDIRRYVEDGTITVQQVDPAELSPGEFVQTIRRSVEDQGAAVVVIDSLNGYLNAMPEERFLTIQLHELTTYLGQWSVATLLIGAHQGLIGGQMVTPVDASYLADAVVLLRYYENAGEVRQAISVMKKRGGEHERTIREFRMEHGGIHLGPPLRGLRGILTGVPTLENGARENKA
jgi:circadian clock protein KaiC